VEITEPIPSVPQKTKPWIIIFVVIVLLCYCCVGVLGLLVAFGKPVLNSLGIQAWMGSLFNS
jgi:hypothetical protein